MPEDKGQKSDFLPLIELPSGPIISPKGLLFIVRQELNQYVGVYANMPTGPKLTREDVDTLIHFGIVQQLRIPEQPLVVS